MYAWVLGFSSRAARKWGSASANSPLRARDAVPRILDWHPRQLRHALATKVRAEYGLEGAAAVLGHSSLATSQIYAEVNETLATKIMAEIG